MQHHQLDRYRLWFLFKVKTDMVLPNKGSWNFFYFSDLSLHLLSASILIYISSKKHFLSSNIGGYIGIIRGFGRPLVKLDFSNNTLQSVADSKMIMQISSGAIKLTFEQKKHFSYPFFMALWLCYGFHFNVIFIM